MDGGNADESAVALMEPDDLFAFLTSNGISEKVCQLLLEQGLNGHTFLTFEKQDYKDLAEDDEDIRDILTTLIINSLVKVRNKVVQSGGAAGDTSRQGKNGSEFLPRRGPACGENLRPFGEPASSCDGYARGNLVGRPETGAGVNSVLEPSREFKRLELFRNHSTIKQAEDPFVEKFSTYAFACLNERINGTIYFGVGDSEQGKHEPGEIVGEWLTPEDKKELQNMLEQNLTGGPNARLVQGLPADEIAAIQACVKDLQFVPVVRGVKHSERPTERSELVVIELDVEPSSEICKDIFFRMCRKKRKGSAKKKGKGSATNEIGCDFVSLMRRGSNSCIVNPDDPQTKENFRVALERRRKNELDAARTRSRPSSGGGGSRTGDLMSVLSLGRSSGFPNSRINYILLSNVHVVPDQVMEWLRNVYWFTIIDVSPEEDFDLRDEPAEEEDETSEPSEQGVRHSEGGRRTDQSGHDGDGLVNFLDTTKNGSEAQGNGGQGSRNQKDMISDDEVFILEEGEEEEEGQDGEEDEDEEEEEEEEEEDMGENEDIDASDDSSTLSEMSIISSNERLDCDRRRSGDFSSESEASDNEVESERPVREDGENAVTDDSSYSPTASTSMSESQRNSFSNHSRNTHLFHFLQNGLVRTIRSVRAEDLSALSIKNLFGELSKLGLGSKLLHVRCGLVENERGTGRLDWYQTVLPGIQKLICLPSPLHDSESIREDMRDTVVVVLVDSNKCLEEMADILKELIKTMNPTQFACLYEDNAKIRVISKEVERVFGTKWRDQMFQFKWPSLNELMMQKLNATSSKKSGRLLPCSGGSRREIHPSAFEFFVNEGIEILPCNQYEKIPMIADAERAQFVEERDQEVKEFLKGVGRPPWIMFYVADDLQNHKLFAGITHGLVERDITKDLVEEVEELQFLGNKISLTQPVVHQPGSGATTIGRHVLWKLRHRYRCIMIDGSRYQKKRDLDKLKDMARLILDFRETAEDSSVIMDTEGLFMCPTILLLFDNCSPEMSKVLTNYVTEECEKRGLSGVKSLLIMICLYSTYDFKEEETKAYDGKRRKFAIERKLSEHERILFGAKLKELQKKRTKIEDLLAFILIAHDFDENHEVVKKVVTRTVTAMEKFPEERTLLLYLSILKYFGNLSFYRKLCDQFVFGKFLPDVRSFKQEETDITSKLLRYSPPFESLVSFQDFPNDVGGGSPWVPKIFMYVSHVPVAYHLWQELLKQREGMKLSDAVREMLSRDVFVKSRNLRQEVHELFKKLLTDRIHNKSAFRRNKYSKIIHSIVDDEGRIVAADVLEIAFNFAMDNFMKAVMAQAIARVFCEDKELWPFAEEWAMKAKSFAPDNCAIIDTLGQVYRKRLKFLEEDLNGEYFMLDCTEILQSWKYALEYFRRAKKMFQQMRYKRKKRREDDDDDEREAAEEWVEELNNSPSFFGIIEVNLTVADILVKSQDLSKDAAKKDKFLRIIMKDVDGGGKPVDLLNMFQLSMEGYLALLMQMFNETRDCLHASMRKLSYIRPSSDNLEHVFTMKQLNEQVHKFNELYGSGSHKWMNKLDSPSHPVHAKLAILRRFFQTGMVNSFAWLSRPQSASLDGSLNAELQVFARHLKTMVSVAGASRDEASEGGASNQSLLLSEDKLSFMNVAFAAKYHGIYTQELLAYDTVKEFCFELVKEEKVDYAEPFFFYLLLVWPRRTEQGFASVPKETLEAIRQCIAHLKESQRTDYSSRMLDPRAIFYLGRGATEGLERLIPGHVGERRRQRNALRCGGVLRSFRDVQVRIGRHVRLSLPIVQSPEERNMPRPRDEVTFILGFTFAGPAAFDVQTVEHERERERLQQLR